MDVKNPETVEASGFFRAISFLVAQDGSGRRIRFFEGNSKGEPSTDIILDHVEGAGLDLLYLTSLLFSCCLHQSSAN